MAQQPRWLRNETAKTDLQNFRALPRGPRPAKAPPPSYGPYGVDRLKTAQHVSDCPYVFDTLSTRTKTVAAQSRHQGWLKEQFRRCRPEVKMGMALPWNSDGRTPTRAVR